MKVVDFGEGSLKGISLDLLHFLRKDYGLKRLFTITCRSQYLGACRDFRLEEGWLVQNVITVHIISRDFDCYSIALREKGWRDLPLVHAEITMGAARRTKTAKIAIHKEPI